MPKKDRIQFHEILPIYYFVYRSTIPEVAPSAV